MDRCIEIGLYLLGAIVLGLDAYLLFEPDAQQWIKVLLVFLQYGGLLFAIRQAERARR